MFRITKEIFKDLKDNVAFYFNHGINIITWIITCIFTFIMYYIGQYTFELRGKYSIGGEAFLPIIFFIIIYYLRSYANKIGKGISIPKPRKRFTKINSNGEVEVEIERIYELLIYLADLEDWIDKNEKDF